MDEPRQEYARRLEDRRAAHAACDRRHLALGQARLAVVVGGALVALGAFDRGLLSGWWLLVPAAAYLWLGRRMQAIEEARERLGRAVTFYQRGLDRLDGRWAGRGEPGWRFLDDDHLYARDLDLLGTGSVFELLCQARTRMGEETLARWLLAPAAPDVVAARHGAVRELAPRLDLREDVAVLGEEAGPGVRGEKLAAWGEAPPVLVSGRFRRLARVLSVVGAASIVAAVVGLAAYLSIPEEQLAAPGGGLPFGAWTGALVRLYGLGSILVFGVITWRFRRRAEAIFHGAEDAAHDVDLLAGVLERLERESFAAPRLATLRAELDSDGEPPSRRIARLERLVDFVHQRHNLVVRVVGPLVLWDVHLAHALEDWRAASGAAMRRWLDAVGEIEALSSIAAYHHERPDDVFAGLSSGAARFEAASLGHPLLPADEAVANDVALGGGAPHVLVVSGSNMSGKSTLLRTVGVAAVLAQAGVPVRARRLRLTPLSVGGSIRLTDSLQEGESRFYAEILRLRTIVERAGSHAADTGGRADGSSPPVLFLIDEFLHGTNSHDRRIGAAAIVRSLVERGAIGLVTTHDLALTHIADDLGERGANVHFEDHLEGGEMSFDYRLRPGVVEKSNALELMRSVGLDV